MFLFIQMLMLVSNGFSTGIANRKKTSNIQMVREMKGFYYLILKTDWKQNLNPGREMLNFVQPN